MKEIETKYVDGNPDIHVEPGIEVKMKHIDKTNAKITKPRLPAKPSANIVNEEKKEEVNYGFVVKTLKENIGIEIDNFLKDNIGQKITKYNADSFTRYAILSLEKSKQEIIEEFNRILRNN